MEELLAQLRSGKYSRIYLLYGSEDYLVRFYSDRLVEKNLSEEDRLLLEEIGEDSWVSDKPSRSMPQRRRSLCVRPFTETAFLSAD